MTDRPVLVDLFCKAGGMTKGYQQAGFYVIGVDIEVQPNYCGDEFLQADAIELLEAWLRGDTWCSHVVAAVHASPPCQAYIRSGNTAKDGRHPDLLPAVRKLLEATRLPYVIENVPGAPMRADVVLCGSMFDLAVRRHRWFEVNWPVAPWTPPCDHSRPITGVYGHPHGAEGAAPGMLPGDLATWSAAMGIDWMTAKEIAAAIPPAYAEHIGRQLMAHVREGVAA